MKKNKVNLPITSSLREKAEEQLKERKRENGKGKTETGKERRNDNQIGFAESPLPSPSSPLPSGNGQAEQYGSEADLVKLNYELEIHKIELELQNKELREALNKAETAIALYDFSPVGSFTLDREGLINQLNLSAAKMLGWNRSVLENMNIRPFVSQDTLPQFNEFWFKAFDTHSIQSCEVVLIGQKNSYTVHLQGIVPKNEQKCHLTALDITDRKIVEAQIQQQKQFFEQMFSESSVSTQILDKDGWCQKINPKLSELFGVKPEDIEGKKYNILQDEALRQEGILPILETVFKEGKTAEWDVFFDIGVAATAQHITVADKNKKRWFHNWAYPIFDQDGLLTHVILQHTDITNRKRNEQRVNDSETRYRRLFETAKDGILILDAASGKIVDVNPYLVEILEYSHDELLGKELWPQILAGVFKNTTDSTEAFIKLHQNGTIRFENSTLQSKSGKAIPVDFISNVYLVDEKQVIQCNIRDITQRLQAEQAIHTLGKAIEQGPSSIVITDANGKIEFVNHKFTEMTQYQLEEVRGKSPRIFNPGRLPENEFVELWKALKEGKTWEGEVLNRKKDQTPFWEEVSISAVKNPDGTLGNYILIQNDSSEKKQILLDLIQAKERAIQSDRLKSAFLANMSHEIRTPLNSIIGFSELMAEPDFDPAQQFQFSQIIFNSGNKLLSIISDLMDLSKIDAGEVKIEPRQLSVTQVLIDIHKEYSFKAAAKDLEWILDLPQPDDLVIVSDENKLRQILINFVGNAIKFTEKGFIEIGARANGRFIQFHVKDTGIGIPAEFQSQLFERFRQVEPPDTRKYGGNGLGLTISKALVELLGGKVWLESREGIGSTFYFMVPIKMNTD